MPCGGVYPVAEAGNCFYCHKGGAKHYFEEFDALVHAICFFSAVAARNDEAWIAIGHGHQFILHPSFDALVVEQR